MHLLQITKAKEFGIGSILIGKQVAYLHHAELTEQDEQLIT